MAAGTRQKFCQVYKKIIRPWTGAFVTCLCRTAHGIVLKAISTLVHKAIMTHFPLSDSEQRSPRVKLNGSVTAAIMAEGGQRARAKLQSISVTGGLLQLARQLTAGDFVEIAFHTRSGAIRGMAEMLRPFKMQKSACMQPFRFIALDDEDHRKLRMALDSALDRGFLDPVSDQLQAPPGF
jgi:hypothetical protein